VADLHTFTVTVTWTGNSGEGTSSYRGYGRDHEVTHGDNPPIHGSSVPEFRGDPERWNPEQMLVAALSQCHMLWYLHLATEAGVVVTAYEDNPTGDLEMVGGTGQFVAATLRPRVTVAEASMAETATGLHPAAHDKCFIARSVAFPVRHDPETVVAT
jgi:organic hydroperoxide reductase OsmC/OhrA